ncbi:MAG: extracellular solute-binding protein [Kiritimatiellia bacterium]
MGKSNKDGGAAWVNYVGLFILLVCYAGAFWNVISAKRQESRADVIRLVHWQLELGVRDGLESLIEQFEAYKKEQGQTVEVVQIPIPERAYNQYVTTQLIGGTAPDMIQTGMFPTEYLGRFFHPLSVYLQQPNPFNQARLNELESADNLSEDEQKLKEALSSYADGPWMNAFTDGLRSQYQETFQEYFGVGFSTFTVRMYYNKNLFQKALGHSRPPESYAELLEFAKGIQRYAQESGEEVLPIASSKYQVNVFKHRYMANLTGNLARKFDLDRSGGADGLEKLMAMLRGDFTPWTPEYAAAIDAVQQLAIFFPKGFMALGREDSGFAFVQGKAAMITSGSWDALSYLNNIKNQPADKRFEVGIFDLPVITAEDEQFGEYAVGRSSEAAAGTGFAFGITRYTRHLDLCVEFLQFATTPEKNTELNLIAGWIPVVHGAVPGELMKNFEPNYVGYFGATSFDIMPGGKALLLEDQIYWPFISGDFGYDTYAERLWQALPAEAATDFKRMYESSKESIPNRQLRRSAFLSTMVLGEQSQEARITNEVNLQRSLEPLLKLMINQKKIDHMLAKTLDQTPDDPRVQAFNQAFFRALDRETSN